MKIFQNTISIILHSFDFSSNGSSNYSYWSSSRKIPNYKTLYLKVFEVFSSNSYKNSSSSPYADFSSYFSVSIYGLPQKFLQNSFGDYSRDSINSSRIKKNRPRIHYLNPLAMYLENFPATHPRLTHAVLPNNS